MNGRSILTTALMILTILVPNCCWSAGLSGLRLSVVPRKSTILLGEPVVLVLTLANVGEDEIRLPAPLEQLGFDQEVQVVTRHEGGLENKIRPLSQVTRTTPPHYLSLAPGGSVEVVWVVGGDYYGFYESDLVHTEPCGGELFCWALPVAGDYGIDVVYSQPWETYDTGEAKGTAQVTVRNPTGGTQSAYDTWVALRPAEGLAVFGSHPYTQANRLEELREAFPDVSAEDPFWQSPYAPYARHLFALSPHLPSDRAAELEQLLATTPDLRDYMLYDEMLFELSETLGLDARPVEAATIREQARIVNPRSVHLVEYQTLGEER